MPRPSGTPANVGHAAELRLPHADAAGPGGQLVEQGRGSLFGVAHGSCPCQHDPTPSSPSRTPRTGDTCSTTTLRVSTATTARIGRRHDHALSSREGCVRYKDSRPIRYRRIVNLRIIVPSSSIARLLGVGHDSLPRRIRSGLASGYPNILARKLTAKARRQPDGSAVLVIQSLDNPYQDRILQPFGVVHDGVP